MQIDIWSDVACPWCYIGKRRFERALAGFPHAEDVEVTWHSFQLDPSLPAHYDGSEVDYLVSRKGLAEHQVRAMTAHVAQQAAGEGLDYDFDRLVVANSLRAHRLLHVAAPLGAGDAVKEGLLRAHFVEGRDIGDDDELVRIGAAAGVPEEAVRSGLDDPEVAASVERDFALARSLGISGVPFFVLDQKYAVSGAQPPEVFQQALEQAWAAAHPLTVLGGDAEACGPDGCAV